MPSNVKRGTDEPLLQKWDTEYDPRSGSSSSWDFRGLSLSKMSTLAATYAALGYKASLSFEHEIATLKLTASFSTLPGGATSPLPDLTDKWEISVDQEKPEIFENEKFLAIVQANDNAALTGAYNLRSEQIMAAMKESDSNPVIVDTDGTPLSNQTGATKWRSLYSKLVNTLLRDSAGAPIVGNALGNGINKNSSTPCLQLFANDYFAGRTSFLRGKYVLRHTTNAPSNYATNVADWNVEKIYSIPLLLSECQSPSYWIMPLPGYLAYKINNYRVPTLRGNYAWGGLKTRSGAITAARGRVEITTEYIIDAWPIHTYGLV